MVRRNLHGLVWHLEDSGINQGRKNKELWQTWLFLSERKAVALYWLFLLPLNNASETFQGRKSSLGPTVSHSCLFLSVYPGIHILPIRLTLLCFSLIPTAMSRDMLPLEDQFPVCALGVWYQFPLILDFRKFCEVSRFTVSICLAGRLPSKEGNQDSHF